MTGADMGRPFVPDVLQERLLERRQVFLRGPLDDAAAGQLAITLMTMDATGDDPISLHVDAAGGTLGGAFAVIDTIDLLGVPVHATCVGRADGPAAGVLAACDQRRASRGARIRLAAPSSSFQGSAAQAEEWLRAHRGRLDRYVQRLSEATGQPRERVEADLAAERWFDAEEALGYGLLDEVIGRPPAEVVPIRPDRH
jgi:ATP-dependent Clp protease protease subunit